MTDDFKPIWFNFGDLGAPGWTPVTTLEARLMLHGAEYLLEDNSRQSCEIMLQRTRQHLLYKAIQQGVDADWISQALFTQALTGLLGYAVPDTMTLGPDHDE